MQHIKSIIPNLITSLNVASGSLSVIFASEGMLTLAGYMILLAAVFDFFDGMSARLLNAYSELGKQLDSLADIVSFGFAPAFIAYQLMKMNIGVATINDSNTELINYIFLFSVILIPVFSGLRLAKFNIDTQQTHHFIGLPTPAHAMIYAAMPIILTTQQDSIFSNPHLLFTIIIIGSLLLVSPITMFSLKFKNLKIKENALRFLFLLISGLIIASLAISNNANFTSFLEEIMYIIAKAVPLILMVYVFLSLITKHKKA